MSEEPEGTEGAEGYISNTRDYTRDFKEQECLEIFESKDIMYQDIKSYKKQLENKKPHKFAIKKYLKPSLLVLSLEG